MFKNSTDAILLANPYYVHPFFETASFHIVKPCNMRCKFCYATFDDMRLTNQLSKYDAFKILDKLKEAGLQKITFAGGEPLLYKWIYEVIVYSKSIGLTTSIITNGSLLTDELLIKFKGQLDWIGVSVDSLNETTNTLIGRTNKREVNYLDLCLKIKDTGFRLKINTVVNSFNWYSDLNDFIDDVKPDRWKVFQALRVEGQNDKQFDEIKVSEEQFESYINTHKYQKSIVVEDNEAMTGSYLLIDPQGRLFENSKGKHTYSKPLQDNDIDSCLSEINLNREMFVKRGGIYEW
jgi:radical S-adenosyl methionine domain-containing protein 2